MQNMNAYGYQQYKEQTVNTMTEGEMLTLLYDEILKRLKRAELSLDNGDYGLFEKSLTRCTEIVVYLKKCLNYNYSISLELGRLYDFFLYEISRCSAGRRKDVIEEIRPLVIDIRDAFVEANKQVQAERYGN